MAATSLDPNSVRVEGFKGIGSTRTLVIEGKVANSQTTMTVAVSDGRSETATRVFRVSVLEESVAPTVVIQNIDVTVVQRVQLSDMVGIPKSFVVMVSDDNSDIGDTIARVEVKSSDPSIVSVSDGSLTEPKTAKASLGFEVTARTTGTATITVTATDSYGGTTTENFTALVNRGPTNVACELSPTEPPKVWTQGRAIDELDVSDCFTDLDGDPLRYTANNLPDGVMISSATGVVSGNI